MDSHDGRPQHHLSPDILAMLGDEEDEEFSDSDESFNSTRSEDFKFSTAAGSRETTPTPQNDITLAMEESIPVKSDPRITF